MVVYYRPQGIPDAGFLSERGDKMSGSIGSKLQSLRKAKGFSQQHVADRIGMKRSTISNYEIDRRLPSLTDLKRIAEFYGVGLDYFDLSSTDSIEELLARARDVFASPHVSKEVKDDLYKEIAMLYFKVKD